MEGGNIQRMFLPPNTNAVIQPIYQGVLKKIKTLCQRIFLINLKYMEYQEDTDGFWYSFVALS